ncbi:MAG: pyrroline-5-carboxylate reductase [Alphaproteobacteria bacterium]|nr:pyrroline-5-carboxylate reductase [Alphaproteobacteria bacterium]
MKNVLIIGCGSMGSALASAWQAKFNLAIIDPEPNAKIEGITYCQSLSDLDGDYWPDAIIFAVKPQILPTIVPIYALRFDDSRILWMSIAAGMSLGFFRKHTRFVKHIVRAMPNMPARYLHGMTVLVGEGAPHTLADELFQSVGKVVWLDDEGLFDAATAISGCGPAYFYLMVEKFAKAGIALGLSEPIANSLARQTLIGAAATLYYEPEGSPADFRHQVTSPNGATEAALSVLMSPLVHGGLGSLIKQAVKAAKDRCKDLGSIS